MTTIQTQQGTQRESFINSFVSQYFRLSNDFIFGLGEFNSSIAGTLSIGNIDLGGHPGTAILSTAALSSSINRIGCGSTTGLTGILFGFGTWKFETQLFVTDLSTATETFIVLAGFTDGTTVVDGCYFRYTDAENSGKWQAVTTSNSSSTTTDTGITVVAGNWYELTIIVNATANSTAFYINGSLVATITTTIPSGTSRQTSVNIAMTKTAGTTPRLLNIDYIDIICKFTNPR